MQKQNNQIFKIDDLLNTFEKYALCSVARYNCKQIEKCKSLASLACFSKIDGVFKPVVLPTINLLNSAKWLRIFSFFFLAATSSSRSDDVTPLVCLLACLSPYFFYLPTLHLLQHLQFATHAICSTCNLHHMQFVKLAICNTYNFQHVQFAALAFFNTCYLQHVHFQHVQFTTCVICNT